MPFVRTAGATATTGTDFFSSILFVRKGALSMHMPKASFVSRLPFRNWIRKFFNPERTAKRRKSETHRRRLSLEHLEDRLVPATVSEAAGVLTFNLNGGA